MPLIGRHRRAAWSLGLALGVMVVALAFWIGVSRHQVSKAKARLLAARGPDSGLEANRAANDLYELGPRALPAFLEVLGDAHASADARLWSAYYLHHPPSGVSVERIRRLMNGNSGALLSALAVPEDYALQPTVDLIGDLDRIPPEVAARVISLLAAGPWGVRPHAAFALGRTRTAEATPALIRALEARNWRVNINAAWALGELGATARDATVALTRIKQAHWAGSVRREAALALARIAGTLTNRAANVEWGPLGSLNGLSGPAKACLARSNWEVVGTDHIVPHLADDFGEDPNVRNIAPGPRRLDVPGGYIVGTDFGEWGGHLTFIASNGQEQTITKANVHRVTRLGRHIVAIDGLAHLSENSGRVLTLEQDAVGTWRAKELVELPAAPVFSLFNGDGSLVVATRAGVVAVSESGNLRLLECTDRSAEVAAVLESAFAHPKIRALIESTLPSATAQLPVAAAATIHVPFRFNGREVLYVGRWSKNALTLFDVEFATPGSRASVIFHWPSRALRGQVGLLREEGVWHIEKALVESPAP